MNFPVTGRWANSRASHRSALSMSLQATMLAGFAAVSITAAGAAEAPAAPAAPATTGVLNLSAAAQTEVTSDVLTITFGVTREGPTAGAVQSALKEALDTALAEAKKAARPDQIDVHTGSFSLYPRYGNKGQMNGWQGSAELIVSGKDLQGIAQLSGRISTMAISRVGYELSREAREKVEGEVTAKAIASYRAKAADYARQFGYGGFTIREVNVSSEQPPRFEPMAMRAKTMAAASDESALPVEPGKGQVSVVVSGTVQMTP